MNITSDAYLFTYNLDLAHKNGERLTILGGLVESPLQDPARMRLVRVRFADGGEAVVFPGEMVEGDFLGRGLEYGQI